MQPLRFLVFLEGLVILKVLVVLAFLELLVFLVFLAFLKFFLLDAQHHTCRYRTLRSRGVRPHR